MLDPQGTLQWQARRIEELEAEVAYLREQLGDDDEVRLMRLQTSLGLTRQEATVIAFLYRLRGNVPHGVIQDHLWPEKDPPEKGVHVLLSKIRHKLAPHGLGAAIETIWGSGYRMTEDGRARLADVLNEKQQGRAR